LRPLLVKSDSTHEGAIRGKGGSDVLIARPAGAPETVAISTIPANTLNRT
jgi:hypothetical protein